MDMPSGREAERSDLVDHAVRFGMVAYGLVHVIVGWIAGQLALGRRADDEASGSGAMHELAEKPFGAVLVWTVGLGMLLLVLWRLLEAYAGHRDADGAELWGRRAASVVKAGVYGVLGFTAIRVALGDGGSSGGSSGSTEEGLTARVLAWPGGTWLVAAAGLAIIGYAAVHAWRGWTGSFLEQLDHEGRSGSTGTAYEVFGRIGYVAKGVALAVVGGFVGYAALTHDPEKSAGLDEALHEILQQPFGQVLLFAVAAGLVCYGLFCFARARHLDR